MPPRPKQRVLVRWNDDLDKSLLLYIVYTCAENGIKIPFDEIAKRMGSTFTEGAITQHLSKLRSKMADLNVVPVPDAPKRGAVTTKPSSVYAQKNRAGPALPQPVASKAQGRKAASGNAVSKTNKKRVIKQKPEFIKRSESDDGHTDDEFDGASEDDFVVDRSTGGKRKRGVDDDQDQSFRKKPMTSDDHWTRANQIVSDTIESTTSADFAPHYNYLSQPAGFEEEEEDDRGREGHGQATQALMPAPNPFALRQDYTASPATMPQMANDFSEYNDVRNFPGSGNSNIQQMSQGVATSPLNTSANALPVLSSSYYPMASQADTFNVGHPSLAGRVDSFDVQDSYNPYAQTLRNNATAYGGYGSNDSNLFETASTQRPEVGTIPLPDYNGMQPYMRNDSLTSSNTQNTFNSPMTPLLNYAVGGNDNQQNSFKLNCSHLTSTAAGPPDYYDAMLPDMMAHSDWGYDRQLHSNNAYDSEHGNKTSAAHLFLNEMF